LSSINQNHENLNRTFHVGINTSRNVSQSPQEKFVVARAPGIELSATFYNMKNPKPINRKLKVPNDDIPLSATLNRNNQNFKPAHDLSNNPTFSELPPIVSRQETN